MYLVMKYIKFPEKAIHLDKFKLVQCSLSSNVSICNTRAWYKHVHGGIPLLQSLYIWVWENTYQYIQIEHQRSLYQSERSCTHVYSIQNRMYLGCAWDVLVYTLVYQVQNRMHQVHQWPHMGGLLVEQSQQASLLLQSLLIPMSICLTSNQSQSQEIKSLLVSVAMVSPVRCSIEREVLGSSRWINWC